MYIEKVTRVSTAEVAEPIQVIHHIVVDFPPRYG
jgi:hypothetical protein